MNMACANRECKAELKYLRGGRLFLMERHPSVSRLASHDLLPPKRPVTMRRYFWLCESCAQNYTIQRWTEDGIELAPRPLGKRASVSATIYSREWTTPGMVG